jgi:hypothetical protein
MENILDEDIKRLKEIMSYNPKYGLLIEQKPPPPNPFLPMSKDKDWSDWHAKKLHDDGTELKEVISDLSMAFGMLSGFISGGIGWSLFAASTALSLAEIKLVLNNGNTYEAGFLFVCTILNFDDVGRLLGGEFYSERFLKQVFEYVKKGGKLVNNTKLSKFLIKFIEKLPELIKMANNKIVSKMISNIAKLFEDKSITWLVGFFYKTFKFIGKSSASIGQSVFPIVGGYITFDQLYKLIYGSNKEKMAIRGLSGVRKLVNELTKGQEIPEIEQKMKAIISGEFSKISNEEWKMAYEKAVRESGGYENFNNSLIDKASEYELKGEFSENSKRIAEEFYKSISGIGTNFNNLLKAIDKIKTPSLFDEINIYLYRYHHENIYDLLNSPFELDFEEKEKIIAHFGVNHLKGTRIILLNGIFKPYTD